MFLIIFRFDKYQFLVQEVESFLKELELLEKGEIELQRLSSYFKMIGIEYSKNIDSSFFSLPCTMNQGLSSSENDEDEPKTPSQRQTDPVGERPEALVAAGPENTSSLSSKRARTKPKVGPKMIYESMKDCSPLLDRLIDELIESEQQMIDKKMEIDTSNPVDLEKVDFGSGRKSSRRRKKNKKKMQEFESKFSSRRRALAAEKKSKSIKRVASQLNHADHEKLQNLLKSNSKKSRASPKRRGDSQNVSYFSTKKARESRKRRNNRNISSESTKKKFSRRGALDEGEDTPVIVRDSRKRSRRNRKKSARKTRKTPSSKKYQKREKGEGAASKSIISNKMGISDRKVMAPFVGIQKNKKSEENSKIMIKDGDNSFVETKTLVNIATNLSKISIEELETKNNTSKTKKKGVEYLEDIEERSRKMKVEQETLQRQAEAESQAIRFLPPKAHHVSRYTMVLDLDETLIHFKESDPSGREGEFLVRPHARDFIQEMSTYYEIIVFTAATKEVSIQGLIHNNPLLS